MGVCTDILKVTQPARRVRDSGWRVGRWGLGSRETLYLASPTVAQLHRIRQTFSVLPGYLPHDGPLPFQPYLLHLLPSVSWDEIQSKPSALGFSFRICFWVSLDCLKHMAAHSGKSILLQLDYGTERRQLSDLPSFGASQAVLITWILLLLSSLTGSLPLSRDHFHCLHSLSIAWRLRIRQNSCGAM